MGYISDRINFVDSQYKLILSKCDRKDKIVTYDYNSYKMHVKLSDRIILDVDALFSVKGNDRYILLSDYTISYVMLMVGLVVVMFLLIFIGLMFDIVWILYFYDFFVFTIAISFIFYFYSLFNSKILIWVYPFTLRKTLLHQKSVVIHELVHFYDSIFFLIMLVIVTVLNAMHITIIKVRLMLFLLSGFIN